MKNEWGGSKQAGFCRFSIAQQPAPEYYEAVEQGEEHVYHMVVPVKSALSTKKKKKKQFEFMQQLIMVICVKKITSNHPAMQTRLRQQSYRP